MLNTKTPDAFLAVARLREQAAASKRYLIDQRAALQAASPCPAHVPFAVLQHFAVVKPLLASRLDVPGMAAAAEAMGDASIVVDCRAVVALMGAASAALVAAFPESLRAELQAAIDGTYPPDDEARLRWQAVWSSGGIESLTLPQADLAQAVAQLAEVVAQIE